jgi:hypothetical protein
MAEMMYEVKCLKNRLRRMNMWQAQESQTIMLVLRMVCNMMRKDFRFLLIIYY